MKKKLITALVLIVIICSIVIKTFAENLEDLQQEKTEIDEQIKDASKELEEVQGELSENLEKLQNLDASIRKSEEEIAQIDTNLEKLATSIKEVWEQLNTAQERYDKQKELIDERLIAIHESSDTYYLDVLVNSASLSEFISNYFFITEMAELDAEILEDLENSKNQIESAKIEIENKQKEYATAKLNKEKTSRAIQNTMIIRNKYVSNLTEDEKKIQEQIDIYYARVKEIETEILQISNSEIGEDYVGGIMAWPIPGKYTITSKYGMRVHPITGVYSVHTGVDVSAPIGTDFIAVNDGVVTKASYNFAYGNMVIIDHGGGVSTLYAHGSEILVTVGQEVKKGTPVLKSGSTGYSTGPHAHFEVRIKGKAVQPLDYIVTDGKPNPVIKNLEATPEESNNEQENIQSQ